MASTGLAKLLAIIGGIVILAEGVLGLLGALDIFTLGFGIPGHGGLDLLGGTLSAIISAIIAIVIGIAVLIATGVVKGSSVRFNGVTLLILGILGILFASWIGGVLVIIAAILLFL
jgi:hypothetical protein